MKKKVIIIGGGLSGCTTAYWLTNTCEKRAKYDVHLYQMGWRLGGKGASGRREGSGESIEHGPHVWFGFYENAFRLMRLVYKDYFEQYGSHGNFTDLIKDRNTSSGVFTSCEEGHFVHKSKDGKSHPMLWKFPSNFGEPGENFDGVVHDDKVLPGVTKCLHLLWSHIKANIIDEGIANDDELGSASFDISNVFDDGDEEDDGFIENLLEQAGEYVLLQSFRMVHVMLKTYYGLSKHSLCNDRLKVIMMTDLLLTLAIGIVKDVALTNEDYDVLNGEEFQSWLKKHGAIFQDAEKDIFVKLIYDAAFAVSFDSKGKKHLDMDAGVAVRSLMLILFGHRGAYMYKMQAGMGEVVFSPIYRLLSEVVDGKPKVNFHFFHKLKEINLRKEANAVERLVFNRQVKLKEGRAYEPLKDFKIGEMKEFLCWPEYPNWENIDENYHLEDDEEDYESHLCSKSAGEKIINIDDETIVILALPAPACKSLVTEVADRNVKFKNMLSQVQTVATVATQLWIEGETTDSNLWAREPVGVQEEVILGGSADPLTILMDYSSTLGTEQSKGARHLLYGCGTLTENIQSINVEELDQLRLEKKSEIKHWIKTEGKDLFPELCDSKGQFDMSLLCGDNSNELSAQYIRVNVEGSHRYVTSVTGSSKYRLKTDETGIENFLITGDWIRNGIDLGCVESAVTSGMLTASSILEKDHIDLVPIVPHQRNSDL